MNTNLEIIRAATIAASPEIMELKFGCTVLHNDGEALLVVRWNTSNDSLDTVTIGTASPFESYNLYPSEYTVLGRPIRLADVLMAIKQEHRIFAVDDNGDIISLDIAGRVITYPALANWNLRLDDLTQQSPETLQFLSDLLK